MRRTAMAVLACVMVAALLPAGLAAQATAKEQGQPPMKLKLGDTAPDFTLKDQTGKEVSLHDFRGKKSVALAFYVFAFTGG